MHQERQAWRLRVPHGPRRGGGIRHFLWQGPLEIYCPESLPLSGRRSLRFAVGDQGTNVLDAEPRIGLIETDGRAICTRGEIDELLKVLSDWGGRRALGKFK